MSSSTNRLAIGTVQFGFPYGIANRTGQVNREEVKAILHHAWSAGIDTLDTATMYGESERRLGEVGIEGWLVVSKLPPLDESCTDIETWIQESVLGSLQRLHLSKIHGLLLHRPQQLLGPYGQVLYRALVAVRDQGKAEKIGISIYGPHELDALWPQYQFDLVQAPFSVLDRRLETSGWLARLHQNGTNVHIRSVFLQGLLLMSPENRPAMFSRWQPLWQQWHRWLDEQALTPVQACIGFAMSRPQVSRVVVGVDSLTQLQEILGIAGESPVEPPSTLMSDDLDLITPSRWATA